VAVWRTKTARGEASRQTRMRFMVQVAYPGFDGLP
jgi:hypothetical protein